MTLLPIKQIAFTIGITFVGVFAGKANAITIDFDNDANGDPINAPELFSNQTTQLTNEFASLGITFDGGGVDNAGEILNASTFTSGALSDPNIYTFIRSASNSFTASFAEPILDFSINASGSGIDASFFLEAFDADTNSLGTASVNSLGAGFGLLSFSDPSGNIFSVTVTETSGNPGVLVFDDLTFEPVPFEAETSVALALLGGYMGVKKFRQRQAKG